MRSNTRMKRAAFAGDVEHALELVEPAVLLGVPLGMNCDVKNWRKAGFSWPQPISASLRIIAASSRSPGVVPRRSRPRA